MIAALSNYGWGSGTVKTTAAKIQFSDVKVGSTFDSDTPTLEIRDSGEIEILVPFHNWTHNHSRVLLYAGTLDINSSFTTDGGIYFAGGQIEVATGTTATFKLP